ncbi:hypothetical protein FFLO_04350 [Filobasidium floriforme]|uniref:Uncharacterized protein n=1 Tax=Filobasidium floriforme TaxID=5210 RepID=A0A8K0JJ51_9TREE|nr:hypothetical protein FFLO_04350 [Filobasidium floriforme]
MHLTTVARLTSSTLATICSVNTLTSASSNSTEQQPEGSFSTAPDGTFISHISADYRSMAASQGGASGVSYFENTPSQAGNQPNGRMAREKQGQSGQTQKNEKGESRAEEGAK